MERTVGSYKPAAAMSDACRARQRGQLHPSAPITAWILFCVSCNCAGWVLSALHQLNLIGYAITSLLGISVIFVFRKKVFSVATTAGKATRLQRRFRRPLPLAFLALALLAFLGGALHAPNNYDALAYRTPRVLHWLAEGRWHWIPTEFQRLNTRACGFEWLSAPLIALTRSDRFLFLINVISLLLLPSLLFSVFRQLGVRDRVAWHWMWLVPTGYCFVLQAGSIGNDLFPAPFVLASLHFALRARTERRRLDLWLSILAAALFTGAKANTLPLLLVWGLLAISCWRLCTQKIIATLLVAAAAVGASFIPTGLLNSKYCGDWTGAAAEKVHFIGGEPWMRVAGNLALIGLCNLTPPIAPFAKSWNEHIATRAPQRLHADFETSDKIFRMSELQVEEGAGLGFGVCVLLGISIVAARQAGRGHGEKRKITRQQALLFLAMAGAVAFYLQASFVASVARLLTPYYALLLIPFLIHPGHRFIVCSRWWRFSALTTSALAALLLILNPARPLFPAQTLLKVLGENRGSSGLLKRAENVYSVYALRSDGFAPARKLLPPDLRVLGLITFDDPETSLWRPFGARRIEHVTHSDSAESLRARGLEYVLVNPAKLQMFFDQTFEQWMAEMHAEIQAKVTIALRATPGPSDWFLVKMPFARQK